MSTVFKINGDTVSREEWESLRENLPTNLKTWLACRDNTLTEEELNQILMIPAGDRWLTSFDNFKNWKPSRFDNVADILLRHGYYDLNVFETHTVSSLVNAGIRVLEELGNDVWQNSVWQRIRDRYDWASLLPQEYLQTYAGWKEGLKKLYNIEFIKRFGSFETLYSVLILRCRLRDFSRPFAVVIQPKSDWNEAFEQPRLLVEELKHLGYQIFYYEAATEEEVQRNLAEATQNGTDKADLIVLSGHGMATSLKLSGIYSWEGGSMNDENLYIDTSDFDKPAPDISLQEFIKPTGDLILDSCSNGEGGETNPNNLANTIARTLPKGVTLHATTKPGVISDIFRYENGELSVTWPEKNLYKPKTGKK